MRDIGESWSGSNIGYQSRMYFATFQRPPVHRQFGTEWGGIHGFPDGWFERTPEEVQAHAEENAGARFADLDSRIAAVVEEAKRISTDVIVEVSPIDRSPGFEREAQLLEELENRTWV